MVERELQRTPEAQGWVPEDKEKFNRWISSWEKAVCSKGFSMCCGSAIKKTHTWGLGAVCSSWIVRNRVTVRHRPSGSPCAKGHAAQPLVMSKHLPWPE